MKGILSTLLMVLMISVGCQSQPDSRQSESTPDEPKEEADTTERIEEKDEKVNEDSELSSEDVEVDEAGCPPPKDSGQICAQVIVWALSPEGLCCEYPTPCHAPEGWQTYSTRGECEEAGAR